MDTRKNFKLSVITVACLLGASSSYAGQITGVEAGSAYASGGAPITAFGVGGWDTANVTPMIINVDTGEEVAGKIYETSTNTYSDLVVGDTFKSLVYEDSSKSVLTGSVHGKDWPVGEPHGIKVANGVGPIDLQQGSGKPASCILSTSFFTNGDDPKNYDEEGNYTGTEPQDEGWLDTADEINVNPTYCDSPFQTHKRFKVDALTPNADATDKTIAKPIDLVFNVEEGETAVREYMLLQKLNNYSDVRYAGVSIEVGFGLGESFINAADIEGVAENLRLSYTAADGTEGEYVFAEDDRATFSAGLFGTEDEKHPNGFFDLQRAGYNIDVDENGTKLTTNGMFGSNYETIFGNWLPSKWEPTAVFFDDDNDPLTDAALVAYWGPSPTDTSVTWRKGIADDFAPVTDDEIQEVAAELEKDVTLYSLGGIEDLLNLGLTYVIEVGDVTSFPSSNFTLRMTPIVSTAEGDDAIPSWIATPASVPDVIETVETPAPSSSGGGSASEFSFMSLILALLAIAGLGGWLVSRKKS